MKKGSDPGFTLLEVLVAVTVLAVSFTALFRLYGGTLRSIENSERYERATVLAERKMNDLLASQLPELGRKEGEFEYNPGFFWTADVGDYRDPIGRVENGILAESLDRAVTRRFSVTVEWAEGETPRSLTLETLKTDVEAAR